VSRRPHPAARNTFLISPDGKIAKVYTGVNPAGHIEEVLKDFAALKKFEKLFGLSGLDALPDPAQFDPTPEDERELRERLLKAGEQRLE
jgi:alkyl hydroperoxide reductase subunit AhpC